MDDVLPRLAPTPWPAEDGGPRRQQRPHGIPGPRARSGSVVAVRHEPVCVMAVLAPAGRLLLLRNTVGPEGVSWVEDLDPETLAVLGRSPDLALGPFWPGGLGVLADGAVIVVQGRWVHRLAPDLSIEVARELPVGAPHNSFVVLSDGSLAVKDLQLPGGIASTLHVLDPVTLTTRASIELPEPCVARLTADGDDLIVVGVTSLSVVRWDAGRSTLELVAGRSLRYLADDGSYGWDPVVDAGAVWFMDNGAHAFPNGMTMLGNGVAAGPVHLWKAPLDGGAPTSVEVSGLAGGAITNPPLVDPGRGLVVAYDSANGVMAAFDVDDLTLRWRRPLATSQHLVLFADTGEILANDHDRAAGDALVVVDVETGDVAVRVPVGSPAQSVVFCAPGTRRDAYYVSLSTVARVVFAD